MCLRWLLSLAVFLLCTRPVWAEEGGGLLGGWNLGLRAEAGVNTQFWLPGTTTGKLQRSDGSVSDVEFFALDMTGLTARTLTAELLYGSGRDALPIISYNNAAPLIPTQAQHQLFNGSKTSESTINSNTITMALGWLAGLVFDAKEYPVLNTLLGFSYTHTEALYFGRAKANVDLNFINSGGVSTILPSGQRMSSRHKITEDRLAFFPVREAYYQWEVGVFSRSWQRPDTWKNSTTINQKLYPIVADTTYKIVSVPYVRWGGDLYPSVAGSIGIASNFGVIPGSSVEGALANYLTSRNSGSIGVGFTEISGHLQYSYDLLRNDGFIAVLTVGSNAAWAVTTLHVNKKEIYRGNEIQVKPFVIVNAQF